MTGATDNSRYSANLIVVWPALLSVMLGGCAAAPSSADQSCLPFVWRSLGTSESRFDERHDRYGGRYISCEILTTPTILFHGIDQIRSAARERDVEKLAALSLPLTYTDQAGTVRRISDTATFREAFDEVFDQKTLSALAALRTEHLTLVKSKGIVIGNGEIWIRVRHESPALAIGSINHFLKR